MSKMVLLNARTFVSGADLSGSGSKIEIGEEWETKGVTNWRSGGATEVIAGLGSVEISAEGQWEAGDTSKPDDSFWSNRRVLEPWSIGPTDASDTSVGALMYLTKALRTKMQIGGAVGDVAPWVASAKGGWPLVRGESMHQSGTARTATGNGTARQLGVVGENQAMYANLHVLSVSGTGTPTLTVGIQSDDAIGFPSSTARGAFAAATAPGGQAIRIPGAIATDSWWRLNWTISGVNPSFLFLVTMGIE
jgi:hypothetical protein